MIAFYASADAIAVAIVAAARLMGEDPEEVARGVPGRRARLLAIAALQAEFPDCAHGSIAFGCGFLNRDTANTARSLIGSYRRGKNVPSWWCEAAILTVRAALHAQKFEVEGRARDQNAENYSANNSPSAPAPENHEICVKTENAPEILREPQPARKSRERAFSAISSHAPEPARFAATPPQTRAAIKADMVRVFSALTNADAEPIEARACDAAEGEDIPLGAPPQKPARIPDNEPIPAPRYARGRRTIVTGAFCGDPPTGRREQNEGFRPSDEKIAEKRPPGASHRGVKP